MALPIPNLDDRSFEQLVQEALHTVRRSCPEWTDLSAGDPGMVLLELFAHLTETMIYRLNRLPNKAYVEFLNLMGVRLQPPAAAGVELLFTRSGAPGTAIEIPRGTRVTVSRTGGEEEPPVFYTARLVTLAAGEEQATALAYHGEWVAAELCGVGTGLPGLSIRVRRSPIVAPTGDELDLLVGVEAAEDEVDEQARVLQHGGKLYRLWSEVEDMSAASLVAAGESDGVDTEVYLTDRAGGTITFAPAARMRDEEGALGELPLALAAVPQPGREIRVWYRRGGGVEGNVAAGTLTVLKDPIPGVEVINPSPATGGQAAESLENALLRGPQELHSLHRAVTAQDYELFALSSARGAVVRARALTRAALWSYAAPGAVEVVLVPALYEKATVEALTSRHTETARQRVQNALDERRPLGTSCVVNWARYKTVKVKANIVVRREQDQAAIRQRVLERLHRAINPLPEQDHWGWPFGQSLRASHVYDIALSEPGVLWVDPPHMIVQEVPDRGVTSIVADPAQPSTWYAGSESTLYRSLDNGEGWEPVGRFVGTRIRVVRTHPDRAGLLAVATHLPEGAGSRVHISLDLGESWLPESQTVSFEIEDLAWVLRGGEAVLLMATDVGLYELAQRPGSTPIQVLVNPKDQDLGFYTLAASRDVRGQVSVAVAARSTGGIYLSSDGGRAESFRQIGLKGQDVRVLAVQYDGPRSFLWAGVAAAGGDEGEGTFRWELRGAEDPPEGWVAFSAGWQGGSCRDLAFLGSQILAATHRAGVLRLPAGRSDAQWQVPGVRCGLPLRDRTRFHPVDTVATDPGGETALAGGIEGVHRTLDGAERYQDVSRQEFSDKVTLPPTWLFCSGEHEVTVVSQDEAQ